MGSDGRGMRTQEMKLQRMLLGSGITAFAKKGSCLRRSKVKPPVVGKSEKVSLQEWCRFRVWTRNKPAVDADAELALCSGTTDERQSSSFGNNAPDAFIGSGRFTEAGGSMTADHRFHIPYQSHSTRWVWHFQNMGKWTSHKLVIFTLVCTAYKG